MPEILNEVIETGTNFTSVANDSGVIDWSGMIETPYIGKTKLQALWVTTRTNCGERTHGLRLLLSNDLLSEGGLKDCTEYSAEIAVPLPSGRSHTVSFIAEGFDPGEVVKGEVKVRIHWNLKDIDALPFKPSLIGRVEMENLAPPIPEIVDGAPTPALSRSDAYELRVIPNLTPKISDIAKVWDGSCRDCSGEYPSSCCKGGQKFPNNCAHFLSDAMIRAGFSDLLTDSALYKCDKSNCGCPQERRPIRAREMWAWFQNKATKKQEKISWKNISKNSGWWAVFQLNETEYWGGHVIVLDTDRWEYYGTCSYPAWDQYCYQW
jgi:hypothetical protein